MNEDISSILRSMNLRLDKVKIYNKYLVKGKSGITHIFDYFIENIEKLGILIVDFLDVPLYVKAIAMNIDTGVKVVIIADKVDPDVQEFINEKDRVKIIDRGKIKVTIFVGNLDRVMA